jgi:hypothetical protein
MSLRIAQLQEVRTAPAAHGAGGWAGRTREGWGNSAIQSQPSCLGELKARLDADAHDHKVRVDALAPLQGDLFVFNPSDLRAEVRRTPFRA